MPNKRQLIYRYCQFGVKTSSVLKVGSIYSFITPLFHGFFANFQLPAVLRYDLRLYPFERIKAFARDALGVESQDCGERIDFALA